MRTWHQRVSSYVRRTGEQMRLLTKQELDAFPYESSVNVALFHCGAWYYADFDGEDVSLPYDEDGDYIPIDTAERQKGAQSILDMSEEQQRRVVDCLWELAQPDRAALGHFFEGELEEVGHCRAYKSPDGKVLRFVVNDEGPFQILSEAAALGFSLGDAAPEWAAARADNG